MEEETLKCETEVLWRPLCLLVTQAQQELDLVLLKEPLVSCRRLPYIAYGICSLIQPKKRPSHVMLSHLLWGGTGGEGG